MTSYTQKLFKKGLIKPPKHVPKQVQYEVLTGSYAYGVENDTSDMDIYGFSIPYKDLVFPHLAGEIPGFGRSKKRFDQFQQHHIDDSSEGKQYDITIYSIVRFFHLCMECNPNMIDVLFVPTDAVLYMTPIGQYVRDNRRSFLHKGAWHRFKGYAYQQLHRLHNNARVAVCEFEKMHGIPKETTLSTVSNLDTETLYNYSIKLKATGDPEKKSPRWQSIYDYGYDVKFGYHIVRLIGEVEQILVEHDLDLRRNREQLKAIRRGEWPLQRLREFFTSKEKQLEEAYTSSTLRHSADEDEIKGILLNCLEMHFGTLTGICTRPANSDKLITELENLIVRFKSV